MDLKDELPGNSPDGSGREQAVIICLQFPIGKFKNKKALNAIFELDAIFREIVEASGIGTYGGNEFAENEVEESVTFYLYGKDASSIYQEVQPVLDSLHNLSGFYIIKRFANFSKEQLLMSS